jgi:hypothetical protein
MGYAACREFGVRGPRRRSPAYGRSCVPSWAVGAAAGVGAGDGAVGAAGQRQDRAAAVLDQSDGPGRRAAWVLVGRDERDAQRFWLSVLGALRQTVPGSALAVERARALGLLAPSAHP